MLTGGMILVAGKAVYDMNKSIKLDEQAEKKSMKAFGKIADAQITQKEAEESMNNAVLRLANRKKAVLSTSMNDFLNVYEKLMKINFTESEGIRELGDFSPAIAKELHTQISMVKNMPKMPAITKNVVVGYLIGGVVGAITSSVVNDSQRNLDLARIQSRQADVIAQQAQGISLAYQAVTERASLMTDVLTKLNVLFVKGIKYTSALIEARGLDKRSYSLEERRSLAACVNLAGAVKDILDVPIIDRDGEITKKSLETIQFGEQCLQAIDFAMTNR